MKQYRLLNVGEIIEAGDMELLPIVREWISIRLTTDHTASVGAAVTEADIIRREIKQTIVIPEVLREYTVQFNEKQLEHIIDIVDRAAVNSVTQYEVTTRQDLLLRLGDTKEVI